MLRDFVAVSTCEVEGMIDGGAVSPFMLFVLVFLVVGVIEASMGEMRGRIA